MSPHTFRNLLQGKRDWNAPMDITSLQVPTSTRLTLLETEVPDFVPYSPAAEERALALRRRIVDKHNAALPIAKLPVEILSGIFLLHRASIVVDDYFTEDLSWIRVTNVCRHWNAVALDCAALWSTITFRNRESVEAMLKRSGNSPLSVSFADMRRMQRVEMFSDILERVLSQSYRLRSLKLMNIDTPVVQSVLSSCNAGAHLLEDLSLSCVPDEPSTVDLELPRNPLPSLRKLHFSLCKIPWNGLPISETLFDLHLQGSPINPYRPSAAIFIRSLQQVTNLKVLSLGGYLPLDAYPPSSEPLLVMDNLHSLRLADWPNNIKTFLRVICIKNTEIVVITVKSYRTSLDRYRAVQELKHIIAEVKVCWIRLRATLTPSRRLIPTRHLSIFECPSTSVYMSIGNMDTKNPRKLGLELSVEASRERCTPFLLTALVDEMEFTTLTGLTIHDLVTWNTDCYRNLFRWASKVTALSISGNSSFITKNILGILLGQISEAPSNYSSHVVPLLSTLEFTLTSMGTQNGDNVYSSLWKLLEQRRIASLGIMDCSDFGQKHVTALERYFHTRVHWDGSEFLGESDEEEDEGSELEADGDV